MLADTLRASHRYLRLRLPAGSPGTIAQVPRVPTIGPLSALRLQGRAVPSAALLTLVRASAQLTAPAPSGVLLAAELPVGARHSLHLLSNTPALPPALVPAPGAISLPPSSARHSASDPPGTTAARR